MEKSELMKQVALFLQFSEEKLAELAEKNQTFYLNEHVEDK